MRTVVKIGGEIVDDKGRLATFLNDFNSLEGDKILVHGGGKIATSLSALLGIETKMVDGRRVTDKPTLEIVTMVYAGLINKTLTAAIGFKAWGICGADAGMIVSEMRPDFGYVGDPVKFNTEVVLGMLESGFIPVVAPITVSSTGELLNTNADTVARTIAVGLPNTNLIYLFDKEGVMNGDIVLGEINRSDYQRLKECGVIHSGMLPKMENAFRAVEAGVKNVFIGKTEIKW